MVVVKENKNWELVLIPKETQFIGY